MDDLKELAAKVDEYADIRQRRLALEKDVEKLKEEESALKATLLEALVKTGAGGLGGKRFRVTHKVKSVPQVQDWDAFYSHIRETGEFELLQRRVSSTAVSERWEAGEAVSGVVRVLVDDLSFPSKL